MIKMNKKLSLFGMIIFCFSCLALAEGPGSSGGMMLTQPMGARPLAMGEAFTSIKGEVTCINYNPAGLASLKDSQLYLFQQTGIFEDAYQSVNLAVPFKENTLGEGVIGLSACNYDAGDIELVDNTAYASRTVKAEQDRLISIAYSAKIGKEVNYGVRAKSFDSNLVQEFSASVLAFDAGVQYYKKNITIGLLAQNYGSTIKYLNVESPIPANVRVGINLKPKRQLSVSLDIIKPIDTGVQENIGFEYLLIKGLTLRGGYKIGYSLDSASAGIGIAIGPMRIDYGMLIMGEVSSVNNISILYKFAKPSPGTTDKPKQPGYIPEEQSSIEVKNEG
ncbi:MAG: hypothetical protein A3J83_01805 [Elusimicrobia bacterium RIFOXYA2_FULL_40_6]|nr:MAG: hypothetical protein A3J83_01805 [Elusimicrobia bacterium RIFOXYA2_FULL_40_6]